MIEVWKPVVGFEAAYEVSSQGRVRSLDRWIDHPLGNKFRKGKLRKLCSTHDGYPVLRLGSKNDRCTKLVHRLVAEAFIGQAPDPKAEVNHKNFCKTDNCVENLDWVSRTVNVDHARLGGRHAAAINPSIARKLTIEDVHKIKVARMGGESLVSIGRRFGIAGPYAGQIVNGKRWAIPAGFNQVTS